MKRSVTLTAGFLVGLLMAAPPAVSPASDGISEPVVYIVLDAKAGRASISSAGGLRVGRWGTRQTPTQVPPDAAWTFTLSGGKIVVTDHSGRGRGSYDGEIFVYPATPAGPVSFNGRRYRGELILSVSGGGLRVVNAVRLEDYLKGVLPAEIGRLGPEGFEAMKAQAVAARSYAIYEMAGREDAPFDLTPDQFDQVYVGLDGEHDLSSRAVEATRGIVAVYDGQVIRANYSSTCGGRTALASAVWPGAQDVPYLRPRKDERGGNPLCSWSKYYRWEEVWGCGAFLDSVRRNLWSGVPGLGGRDPGRVDRLKVLKRTPSGRVAEMAVWTESGRYVVRGDRVRWVLRRADGTPLRSSYLGELKQEERGGRCVFVLEGGGWGHGVGLCQTGAIQMSREGYTYRDILAHYYADIRLARIYDDSGAHRAAIIR